MEEGKIYITITDKLSEEPDGSVVSSGDSPNQKVKQQKTLEAYATHRFFNFVESQAKTIANYSVSNIGNFTGDFQMQRDIDSAVTLAKFGVNLIASFKAGMVFSGGNVAGGLVAVGIALATEGINYGLQEKSANLQIRNQMYTIEQLRTISGLNGLTNGGR